MLRPEPIVPSPGCLACAGYVTNHMIDWQRVQTEPSYFTPILWNIRIKQQSYPKGYLCICAVCEQPWFMNLPETVLVKITPENRDIVFAWASSPVHFAPKSYAFLRSISGISRRGPEMVGHVIRFTCALKHWLGSSQNAIISFQDFPPSEPGVQLASPEMRLGKSNAALPTRIQAALENAWERSMNYAPIAVIDGGGRRHVLNYYSVGGPFVSSSGVLGSALRLAPSQNEPSGSILPQIDPDIRIVGDLPPHVDEYITA